jgi:peptidoglycan/xylan/chitin deacetylase (PgdA/CDA1 family)
MSAAKQRMISALNSLGVAEVTARMRRQDMVLCYHSVERVASGFPHSVSTANFLAHLGYLTACYDVVPLPELFQSPGTRSRVAITFDDAYAELYEHALPAALERRVPVTVFVPTRFSHERARLLADYGPGSNKEHLTWAQMREMQATGLFTFESHGHAHLDSVRHAAELRADLLRSRALISDERGHRSR